MLLESLQHPKIFIVSLFGKVSSTNTNMLACSHFFFCRIFFLGSYKLYCFLAGANAMCHGEEGTYDFFHVL